MFQFTRKFKQAEKIEKVRDFAYQYAPLNFEKILQNWIKKYKEMPDFFDRFFENIVKDDLSSVDKFENLCQALLSYYNYNFEKNKQLPKEYTSFFNTLLDKLDTDEKQLVERFRSSGNQFSLRDQLGKIFEQLEYLKDETRRKKYVNDIVLLRNRVEHATENLSAELYRDASNIVHNLNSFTSNLILYEIEYERNN